MGGSGGRLVNCIYSRSALACSVGKIWAGSRIECQCDNTALVVVVNSGTLMNLLRCMFFMASHCSVQVHATHIPGNAADALSPRLFCRLSRKTPHQFLKLFWTWQSRNSHTGPSCGGHDSSVLSEGGTSPVNPARIPVFQEQISCLLPKCRNSIPTHFGG